MKKILYSQRLRLLWAAVCLTVGIGPILAVPTPKGKITVSGMVTDKNKQPLIGVTVIIKDTFSGTTTDNAGKYTINAASSDVLEFSLLGYTQQEALVGTRSKIDIIMAEDLKEIDAVVIEVGYGEQRKKDVSGSVGIVKVSDMIKAPVTSFDQALQGRVAGVNVSSSDGQPGTDFNIVIRGTNSLTQDNSPLYVIDGFPIENFSNAALNPEDIESMTILKDASATAIYGSRGANGVIIIETKKGKVGRAVVSYTGTFGVQSVTKKIDMMSSYDYVKYLIERDESNYATFLTNEGRTLDDYRNIRAIDWQDKIFRTAFVHMHNVSLRGGNKMTRYAASASLSNQPGVIVNSGYKKYQGRVSLDQQISKAVKLSLNANYTQDKISGQTSSAALSTSNSYATYLMYRTWAFRPVMLSHQNPDDLFDDDFDGSNSAVMNPYITTMNEDRHQKRSTFIANAKLGITLAKGLTLNISGGYTSYNSRTTEFNNSESYKGYPRPNNSKNVNASVADYLRNDWMNENVLTYKRKYNNKHNFDVMVGFTMQGTTTEKYGFETTNIPDEGLGLSGMDDGLPYATNVSLSENTLMSALVRVNYNYKSRYMFTTSFRADGSSKFMDGHRWGYFPSGAFAWRMGEEPWLRMAGWINEAKLRVSVGMTGNNRVGDFSAYPSISMSDYYSIGNATPGEAYIPNNLGNRDLTWETTTQYNIGYDLSLFRSRLNFTVDL